MIRALERLGFRNVRTTGSHVYMYHALTKRLTSVPSHAVDLKRGLLFGILKQAGISIDEFRNVI